LYQNVTSSLQFIRNFSHSQVNGKVKNSITAPEKFTNRSSSEVAWVTKSGLPHAKFHHDTITSFDPQYEKNVHQVTQLVLLFLFNFIAKAPAPVLKSVKVK